MEKNMFEITNQKSVFFPIFPSTPDEFHLNLTELNIAMRFAVTTNPHGSKSKVGYPLVNIQKAIENGHRNSRFTHQKWWLSIVNFPNLPGEGC